MLTLFGLEILTLLFKSVGIRNALFAFSTASREELKKISGEVLRRGHRVISYTTREEERDGPYALSGHAGGPHPQAERRAIVVRVYPVVAGHDAGIDGVGCSFGANGRRFCLRALRENSAGKSAGEFRTAVGIRSSDECETCRSPLSVQSVLLTIVYESLDRRFLDRRRHHPVSGGLEIFKYIGPGLLVTVGFIDPGNWASNLAAGAEHGYALLWMVTRRRSC